MDLALEPTGRSALPVVIAAERSEHARPYVEQWSEQEHARAIADPDQEHLLICAQGVPVGFALSAGLQNPHGAIELRRLVLMRPGEGIGRRAIVLLLARAFTDHHAHRVWLDVMPHNLRAVRLYTSVGFQQEGLLRDALRVGERFESLIVMSMLETEWPAASVARLAG
jgi:diamine N-acetyltransferase